MLEAMYEWRTGEFVPVEVEPASAVLIVDGDQSWFEVDVTTPEGVDHYAVYNEIELRWESGEL